MSSAAPVCLVGIIKTSTENLFPPISWHALAWEGGALTMQPECHYFWMSNTEKALEVALLCLLLLQGRHFKATGSVKWSHLVFSIAYDLV